MIKKDTQLRIAPSKFNIIFYDENGEVGKFWWDRKELQFKFKGNVDKSAKKFIDFVLRSFQYWFEERYG